MAHIWIDNAIGEIDTAADDKPETSFDTASSTWMCLARAAVLCSRAEFASNQGSEGTMRREVIGTVLTLAEI